MSDFDRLDFRAGDALSAHDLQAIVDAVRARLGSIEGGAGVHVHRDSRGNVQISGASKRAFVGVANGNIPACSGSTWGSGSVTWYDVDASNVEYSTGVNFDVLNPSSNTMTGGAGITSGKRCFVQEDEAGRLIVAPLEC